MIDAAALARELADAFASGAARTVPPSSRDAAFDVNAAYAVESELVRLRRASGRKTAGVKVGYANKAVWRVLKIDTLVWAHMYDDTVRYANGGTATLAVGGMIAPKIEPEIVFRLKEPVPAGADAASALSAVEWMALGFEIIDCPYPDWKFQPADFLAAYGLHAALVVGTPVAIEEAHIASLVEALPRFTVSLLKDGVEVEQGSGKNSLRSPALCLAELASAMSRRHAPPLAAGELVSSGTLTESRPLRAGETWRAEVAGLPIAALELRAS